MSRSRIKKIIMSFNVDVCTNFKFDSLNQKTRISKNYRTIQINNRRYLGNKYKLLDFISDTVNTNTVGVKTVADIFAGTGSVASAFTDKTIITNDILYSNYISHICWFGTQPYSEEKIINYVCAYNFVNIEEENYMTENFSDTYFSHKDCCKIGFIRQNIEDEYNANKLNERERAILITSLIYAMDKIANTCGHYDAYRKGVAFLEHLYLSVPKPPIMLSKNNACYNMDANELVKKIVPDLVYIDPPYNSRQYCDTYHLLENVARWEKPTVKGVARKMDRTKLKSNYCTINAPTAFDTLVKDIHSKYILLSYNNMATKGNGRSNAKISDEDIMKSLSQKGEVRVFSMEHRAFSAGKSSIKDNKERLFLCHCY